MKRYLLLVFFFTVYNNVSAQKKMMDVIHLKNGEVLWGSILEIIPDQSITVKTVNNNTLVVYPIEVSKITREEYQPDSRKIEKRGYVGHSIGLSSPIGGYYNYADNGIDIGLLRLAHLITKRFGLTGGLFVNVNPIISYNNRLKGGVGAVNLMIGPYYSYPFVKNKTLLTAEFRIMLGHSTLLFFEPSPSTKQYEDLSFVINSGATLKLNIIPELALLLSYDIFLTDANFESRTIGQKEFYIQYSSLSLGIAFCFR